MRPAVSDEEVAFRSAVVEANGDQTPRLVYADWLAEEGREVESLEQRVIAEPEKAAGTQGLGAGHGLTRALLKLEFPTLEIHFPGGSTLGG